MKPPALLAYAPASNPETVAPEQRARLAAMLDLLHPAPIEQFDVALDPLLARTEILVTGWGAPAVDPGVLARLPRLRLVAHFGGTVKFFLDRAVWRRGVRVTNAVAANAIPVAEFTLAAILFANKQVFRLQRRYAQVRGDRKPWSQEAPGLGNWRKTVGIIGASRIGRRVIALLAPFDFHVLLADPTIGAGEAARLGVELVELDALMARSDLVSIHAPSLPSTRHLIDRRRLALLRDGGVLINTARGAIVDQQALIEATRAGRIDAVIDVTEPDILPPDSPLYDIPNVFLTPHIAGALGPETQRMSELILQELGRFLAGEALQHEVRLDDLDLVA
jgi:phosphoglycerate dehydrogenase-like enzyme